LAYTHLQPEWHLVEWRRKHLASQDTMMHFLMKHCLQKTALAEAERAYHSFRRKMSESGVELIMRLRTVYNTACLSRDFANRVPEYTMPEMLVRSLDEALSVRLVDGLQKRYIVWRREKLERQGRISPDVIRGIVMKIQAELDTQITLMARTPRAPPPSVTFQPSAGRRPPFSRHTPVPRRSETAYAVNDEEWAHDEQEWGLPFGGGDGGDAVLALGGRPNAPPPSRPPIGSMGPPVPESSRFPPTNPRFPPNRGAPGPRQQSGSRQPSGSRPLPDESRQGRFTMGHANYGGCHNCGDKAHMARDCPKPAQQRLLALVSQTEDWALEDAEAFLEQGLPECLDHYWTDPQVIMDYCQQVSDTADRAHKDT
jgi:hypothetical protein